jgi:tetratricopeptide (TPR) repeat protein
MKKTGGILLIVFTFSFIAACGKTAMDREYERIKTSGLTGDALRAAIAEFELKNTNHFSSKVDLGGFYLLNGNIELAANFFRRAERVVRKAPRNQETRNNIAIMYGSLARIYLLQSDFNMAVDYVEKAIATGTEQGELFRWLKPHIFIAQDKQDDALVLFYELYQTHRNLMTSDDIRAFMYLLARAERFGDCAAMVDLYFERGPFFPGLGLFASGAYEAAGQITKAIFAAFLDYEYNSGYFETNDSDFLANINFLERQLELNGTLNQAAPTLHLIRSLFDNSDLTFTRRNNAFFVEDYCYLKKKILTNTLTIPEFEEYLRLERYFTRFPVYYWNVWQAALGLFPPASLATYVPALEKIILLDRNGRFAQAAWEELTKFMGYARE